MQNADKCVSILLAPVGHGRACGREGMCVWMGGRAESSDMAPGHASMWKIKLNFFIGTFKPTHASL